MKQQYAQARQGGFTLIEVIAVIVIIGFAVGIVSISVGDSGRPQKIKAEARGLYNAMSLAVEEAVFTRKQLGLRFDAVANAESTQYEYSWLSYDANDKKWRPFISEVMERHIVMEGLAIELEIEGQTIIVGQHDEDSQLFEVEEKLSEKEKALYPDIYFFSSGEMLNFKIKIQDQQSDLAEYEIIGNMLGQLELKGPDEQE